MKITSSFCDSTPIPEKYSRDGGDISPPIHITEVPENTKSLALICHDPDASKPGGWCHWLVWNISPNLVDFNEGTIPQNSVSGMTDWNENHWGGPKPPNGQHHYIFTVYALNTLLNLPSNTNMIEFIEYIKPYVIETARITGLYKA